MTMAPGEPDRAPGLGDWLASHGPLAPAAALVVALDACSRASRLGPRERRTAIGSLHVDTIRCDATGRWAWTPRHGDPGPSVGDEEIVERIGVLLFACLTCRPPVLGGRGAEAARAQLRALRPDLPASVADVVAHALSVRSARRGGSIDALARGLRRALGARDVSPIGRRALIVLGLVLALAGGACWWWLRQSVADDVPGSHGLSRRDTIVHDALVETVHMLAMTDEHTAALQHGFELQELLRARFDLDDPRLAWSQAQEAWVRALAGDRLTAEQLLEGLPRWLGGQLGEHHPIVRAARLELAEVLAARGLDDAAAPLRATAAQDALAVLADPRRVADVQPGVPAATGVIAHVAPNVPEREGFRKGQGHTYFVPLTSTARWIAGRDGWRIHVAAAGACRVSLVAGAEARKFVIDVSPSTVSVTGTRPALHIESAGRALGAVTLLANSAGQVRLHAGDQVAEARVDDGQPPPVPPFAFAFEAQDAERRGCGVVWGELPYPWGPATR